MGYQIHYVSNKISQRCILLYILKFLLVRISFCMILLMTEILHQLIVYPIIYRVLYIPRCDRRISEPSTILDFLDRQAEIVPSNLVVVGDLRCKKKPSRNQPKITKSKNWKIATSGWKCETLNFRILLEGSFFICLLSICFEWDFFWEPQGPVAVAWFLDTIFLQFVQMQFVRFILETLPKDLSVFSDVAPWGLDWMDGEHIFKQRICYQQILSIHMCDFLAINSHYFQRGWSSECHQPNSTGFKKKPIRRIPTKGGMTIRNIGSWATLAHMYPSRWKKNCSNMGRKATPYSVSVRLTRLGSWGICCSCRGLEYNKPCGFGRQKNIVL